MNYHITDFNNFCRVFELPEHYPEGFCFNGPISVEFKMVDFFNPFVIPNRFIYKSIRDIYREVGPFILGKIYIKPNRKYLIIFDFGASIIIETYE